MSDNPISLDDQAAPDSPTVGRTAREVAEARIASWFSRHGQPYVAASGGFASSIRPVDSDDVEPVQLRVLPTTTQPLGILFAATGGTRYARERWPEALAACNVWNGRDPVARARLAVQDWEHDDEAPIVFEAWVPLLPSTSQDVVNTTGDALVASAARFWFAASSGNSSS